MDSLCLSGVGILIGTRTVLHHEVLFISAPKREEGCSHLGKFGINLMSLFMRFSSLLKPSETENDPPARL